MAMNPATTNILTHLRRRYPHPEPDPAWVAECISALVDDGQNPTPATVEEQYLWSHLGASTRTAAGSGVPLLPPRNLHNTTLFATPTLLQLESVEEIGVSAFQLRTTVEQRRDIISGATRIRRLEDEEADEPQDGEAANRPPPYGRSMLKMNVSDGRNQLPAIEYQRIPNLTLGDTALGTKPLNNPVLLSPDNCQVIGGSVEALQEGQATAFLDSLEERLERARSGAVNGVALPPPVRNRRTLKTRANNRQTAATASACGDGFPDRGRAARLAAMRAALSAGPAASAPATAGRPGPEVVREAAAATIETSYHDPDDYTNDGGNRSDDSFQIEIDDNFIQHIEAAEAEAVAKLQPRSPEGRRGAARRAGARNQRGTSAQDAEVIELLDSD